MAWKKSISYFRKEKRASVEPAMKATQKNESQPFPQGAVELNGPSEWSHIKAKGLRLCPLSRQLVIKSGLPPVKGWLVR